MFQNIAKIEVAVERNAGRVLYSIRKFVLIGFFFWVILPLVVIMMMLFNMFLILVLT